MQINLPKVGLTTVERMDGFSGPYVDYVDIDAYPLQNTSVELDINFYQKEDIKQTWFIPKMEHLDQVAEKAWQYITSDFEKDSNVTGFFEEWIDILDPDDLEALVSETDSSLSIHQQLLSVLTLVRIGFYVGDNDDSIVLDYVLNPNDISFTENLLSVKLNPSLELIEIVEEG